MSQPARAAQPEAESGLEGESENPSAQVVSAPSKRVRNIRVEALRLAAIVGISVFHVFTPWFFWATHPSIALKPAGLDLAPGFIIMLTNAGWPLWVLGLVALLGAWGNHIFYMISAFYLVPAMAEQVGTPGYWRKQWKASLHRCAAVLAAVVFYALLALIFSRLVRSIPGVGSWDWIGPGLEFIWLYLLFILLAPVWAWLVRRWEGQGWARGLLLLFAGAVYALNFYIAFISQGDTGQRGLLDWRKQMSAVTYLLSFMLAGALSWRVRRASARGESSRWASPRAWGYALSVILLVTVVITGVLVLGRLPVVLYDLSFKSTSLLAFVLALAALFWCALSASAAAQTSRAQACVQARGRVHGQAQSRGLVGRTVTALASGILGFYIVQSLTYTLWDPFCARLLTWAIRTGASVRLLAVGAFFALAFVLVVTLFDRLVRQPLMRKLGL
ncbi:hypothetical protein KIM372_13880 [Bombiscardovia nodaiensis]|uniref:Acyltransferase 3 domain-containing protein n=1 Tax=Bombiscardovia nodaiensis TaxID=2932181 RepID=A0ABM8B9B5_9BIFI|nr:hypothetical protein KIM372_13880 [Bombiscardovia nodaiensis]